MAIVKNPNFKNNREFHRSLAARGVGARDYPNSHTEVERLGNGKFGASLTAGHRVFFDKADGAKAKKHKLTDDRPGSDYVLVQGPKCCVEVHPYYARYFDVQHEEVRLHEERWVVQRLFKEPDEWRDVGAWNPVIAIEEYSDPAGDVVKITVTYDTDYGPLTVEYFQRDGNALKHNVTFRNTAGPTETFRVVQAWAGIVGAKCNGRNFPVDVDEPFLAFHDAGKPAKEFSIAENLYSMLINEDGTEKTDQRLQRPIAIEAHAQGMKADFVYGNWVLAQDDELEIDPSTVTLDDPTVDGYCTSTATKNTTATTIKIGKESVVCLTSKTLISMADGTIQPVEGVKVGDQVKSFDTEKNEASVSGILSISNHIAPEYIIVNEILEATPHHLIWTSGGFKTVAQLEIGEQLLDINGKWVVVETIRTVETRETVHELGLSGLQTYYADGFLVHNQWVNSRGYVEWDISGIDDRATIADTVFKYHGSANNIDCHIREMVGYQPSLGDAASIYAEAGEGTVYADPAGFPVAAANQSVDLGAAADSDLEDQLGVDWFAIGIISDDEESYDLSYIWSEDKTDAPTPKPTLYVEYFIIIYGIILRPVAPGDLTQLTIKGDVPAATNWESVDEEVADENTTWVGKAHVP